MRTKVLLSAAALAAGALTSMAQVYSANIVGYVNAPTPTGFTYMSNPLDATPDNKATSVIPNPDPTQDYSGPYDGSTIQEWTGAGFKISVFDSVTTDTTTGFTDIFGSPVATPNLTSGKGWLFNNAGSSPTTMTLVGQVRTGTNTLVLPPSPPLLSIGSMIPVAGGPVTSLGFNNPDPTQDYSGPLDGDILQILKVSPSGQSLGYKVYVFDSVTTDTTTGFTDIFGSPLPEPQIPMAGGFLFGNQGQSSYTYQQILNP